MNYFKNNQELWDSRVAVHLKSELYDHEKFMAGKCSLTEIERDALGDVAGKSLLHLQCHFGQDTLSWARRGAKVTGIDFSQKAIDEARKIAEELKLEARFITTNVYDLPEVLDEKFDFVFSTFGAIPWLPDLGKWAKIVGQYLKPGGIFYLAEFHPAFYLFNFENGKVEFNYFNTGIPYEEIVEGTYADKNIKIGKRTEYFWNHSITDIVNPLIGQGLNVLELNEHDFSPFNCFPNMKEVAPGRYVWNPFGVRIPHVLSLKMRKDEK